MNDLSILLYMTLGIAVSVILPSLSAVVRQFFQAEVETHGAKSGFSRFWRFARPYVYLGMFSVVTAGILLAAYRVSLPVGQPGVINTWAEAFLYGYAYDSTIQKLVKGWPSSK